MFVLSEGTRRSLVQAAVTVASITTVSYGVVAYGFGMFPFSHDKGRAHSSYTAEPATPGTPKTVTVAELPAPVAATPTLPTGAILSDAKPTVPEPASSVRTEPTMPGAATVAGPAPRAIVSTGIPTGQVAMAETSAVAETAPSSPPSVSAVAPSAKPAGPPVRPARAKDKMLEVDESDAMDYAVEAVRARGITGQVSRVDYLNDKSKNWVFVVRVVEPGKAANFVSIPEGEVASYALRHALADNKIPAGAGNFGVRIYRGSGRGSEDMAVHLILKWDQ